MKVFSVREIMGAIDEEVADILREDALAATTAVVIGTPVGNPTLWDPRTRVPPGYAGGYARRQWHVTIGAPSDAQFDAIDPGGVATINEARARIATYGASALRRGLPINLQNAAPYIVPLNNGSSTQAPAGFVEMAVAESTQDTGRRELP